MAETTLVGAEKRPRSRSPRPNRCGANVTLHLIDIDNLLGDPRMTDRATIERTYEHYRWVADYRPGDHVVVATGCNGMHVLEVELAWPGVSHRRKRGQDGADHVLCAEAEWAAANGAYDRVVIASGDREFMVAFQNLLSAGVNVQVVASHRRLAVGLAALAHGRLRYFGTPTESAQTVRAAA